MHTVIIGAGPAGLTVAEQLREGDGAAEITMISAEPFPPYAPPALADYFTTGNEEALFWKGKSVSDDLRLRYRSGTRVANVLPDQRRVILADGEGLAYDRLVIASGSRLYAPLPGYDLPGVYNFKSLEAASALVERVRLGEAKRGLIVGAGFIGVEVALLLTSLGLEVTLIEKEDRVMPGMLDTETAGIVLRSLEDRGVRVRLETEAGSFSGRERTTGVVLASGESLESDVYVAATGVKPNVEYLDGSGIDVEWGILVDEHLCTSVPEIYAAGDVAETQDRLTGERYVHAIFPNAVAQGAVVADNLLGRETAYEGAERMNSLKHLGLPVVAVGEASGEETLRWAHGDSLRKIFLHGGRIVGFRLSGDIRRAGIYRSLMLKRADVTRFGSALADPRFSEADLLPASVAWSWRTGARSVGSAA